MANRTYLIYQNKNNRFESFEYAANIPSLWQELYNVELLVQQEERIIIAFTQNENQHTENSDNDTNLKIPIEVAIKNLEIRVNLHQPETDDKRQLRIEFLDFLKNEVAEKTNIEITIEEISWFYKNPKDIFIELKKFHTDTTTQREYQNEKVTYQTIGINWAFTTHSSIYRKIEAEGKIINEKNAERFKQQQEKTKKQQARKNTRDLILMSLIGCLVTFGGFLGIEKGEILNGVIAIVFGLACWVFVYFKYIKKGK